MEYRRTHTLIYHRWSPYDVQQSVRGFFCVTSLVLGWVLMLRDYFQYCLIISGVSSHSFALCCSRSAKPEGCLFSRGHSLSTVKYIQSDIKFLTRFLVSWVSSTEVWSVRANWWSLSRFLIEILLLFSELYPCCINLDSNAVLLQHNRTYYRRVAVICSGKVDTNATIAWLPKYALRPVTKEATVVATCQSL